ncbi:Alginate lyase 7 [Thalassocella blandensis]|nr:Alginate lyase 7 [Thalassocella blandensis]
MVDSTEASTTVTDDADATTVSLSADDTVEEGGVITYTATLEREAQSEVRVVLDNGQTIVIAAGETSGTVEFAPDDDYYAGDRTVTASIESATGGNFENLVVDSTEASTTVTDDADATSVSLSADDTIVEGGVITYMATLEREAQSEVRVDLDNGQTIVIAAGETTGTIEFTPDDDYYAGDRTVTTSIESATGGNFENLVIDSTEASTTVTDDADTTSVSLSADDTVIEGGVITYTATLEREAQSEVRVVLDNGQTIVIAAGETTGTVEFTPDDDYYAGDRTVTASIESASGGNFENLVVDSTEASTTVTDDADATTVSLSADDSVVEGGVITYTATLEREAQSEVRVVLDNGQTVVIAAGETTGSVEFTPNDDYYADDRNVTASIESATGGNFENLVVDSTEVSTTVTDDADATSVSLSADDTVVEGGVITYTATLEREAQSEVRVVLDNGQTIVIAAGETTGTVEFTPDDDYYAGDRTVTASIESASGGNFENLVVDSTEASTTVTDDADATSVSLSADDTVVEGGVITYTATLEREAQSEVRVVLDNGQTIVITAGETAGTVEFTPDDDYYAGDRTVTASIESATGGNFENLVVDSTEASTTVTDDADATSVSLSADDTVVEGGVITYTATLEREAQSEVRVVLDNGQTIVIAAGETTGSIEFTPDDDYYAGDRTVSASIESATGGNFENLVVDSTEASTTVTDDADATSVSLSADDTVVEGGVITYTATLEREAQSEVRVVLNNGQTIVIAAGETTGTVEFTPDDDYYAGDRTVTASIESATGGNFENLVVDSTETSTTVTDDADITNARLSATSEVNEGEQITYTVTLDNPARGDVTIVLSNGATVVVASGSATASVSVVAGGGNSAVVNIVSATGGGYENLVSDNTPVTTTINDLPPEITVTANDVTEESVSAGDVIATFASSDPGGDSLSHQLLNNDEGYFEIVGNEVRLTSAGVNAINNDALNLNSLNITVQVTADGQSVSDNATSNITRVNEAPLTQSESYSAVEGSTLVVSAASGVLANDTDPEGDAISAQSFATDATGTNEASVNGSNSVTTALGGTVVLNADGSFTYQAPASLDHSVNPALQDSFVYRASDGSLSSEWTEVFIDVSDTAPQANDDVDAVSFGGVIYGNVISGVGNAAGQDELGADAVEITSVNFNGQNYSAFDGAGNLVVNGDYGTLVLNRNGEYSYTSTQEQANYRVGGGGATTWADVDLHGFSGGTSFDNGGWINLGASNGAVYYGINGLGIDSFRQSGDSYAQIDQTRGGDESLVIDLKQAAISAEVTLGSVESNDGGRWTIYDANGRFIATSIFPGGSNSVNINTGAEFQYIAFSSADNNDDYSILELNYTTPVPNIQDDFTYSLRDSDGDISQADLVISHESTSSAQDDSNVAYEAATLNGSQSGELSAYSTGNILDNDEALNINSELTQIEYNGYVYTPDGNGVITIPTNQGVLTVFTVNNYPTSGVRAGDYSYEIQRSDTLGDDGSEEFIYTLKDGVNESSASLTIDIVDDAPVGGDVETTIHAAETTQTYNLVIVLDKSGSMGYDVNGRQSGQAGFDPTQIRMDIARDALSKLFDSYDGIGNVNIRIVDFSDVVSTSGWLIDNVDGAMDYLNGINPVGGTHYSSALNEVMDGYNAPEADRSLVYFISDGEPTNNYRVGANQQAQWESFIDANDIDISFGIGIGNVSVSALEPIAYPNDDANNDGVDDYAIQVEDANDLATTLLATLDHGVVTGNISILEGDGSTGFFVGADGGFIQSIVVDGVLYSYDPGVTDKVTIETELGGTLTVDFESGEYFYQVSLEEETTGEQERFVLTAMDNDGDSLTANLLINLEYSPTLDANRDTVITNVTTGLPVAISDKALLFNDVPYNTPSITGVSDAVSGTVSRSGSVITFVPNGEIPISRDDFSDTASQIYENGDSETNPINNTMATATVISRTAFGANGSNLSGLNWFDGYSVGYYGSIAQDGNTLNGSDQDWLKINLAQGEVISLDIDGTEALIQINVYDDAGNYLQTIEGNPQPYGSFEAFEEGDYFFQINPVTDGDRDYELYMSINADEAFYPTEGFQYNVSAGGISDSTYVDVVQVTGSTITGTGDDEVLVGSDNSDTLQAQAGDDVLQGGAGDDILEGGEGDDLLLGGMGDDILSGGLGSDVFAWELADRGEEGTPNVDVITDFDNSAVKQGGDVLDLRDLLVDESEESLTEFLYVEVQDGNTIVHVSSTGGFSDGVYNSGSEDQLIEISGVDLVSPFGGDQEAIIQDLINRGKLITD